MVNTYDQKVLSVYNINPGGAEIIGLKLFRFFRNDRTIKEVFGTAFRTELRNITWFWNDASGCFYQIDENRK